MSVSPLPALCALLALSLTPLVGHLRPTCAPRAPNHVLPSEPLSSGALHIANAIAQLCWPRRACVGLGSCCSHATLRAPEHPAALATLVAPLHARPCHSGPWPPRTPSRAPQAGLAAPRAPGGDAPTPRRPSSEALRSGSLVSRDWTAVGACEIFSHEAHDGRPLSRLLLLKTSWPIKP